jgi:hypothetical protein
MAEENQMPRDLRDAPMPIVKTVRVRSLSATTTSGSTQTPELKWKAASLWADVPCWISYGADPVAVAALTQLSTITITWTTAEADDVFTAVLTHQDGTTSSYPLTTTTEANAGEVATALAALVDAHASYSASATGAVITIVGPVNGDSYSVSATAVNGGAASDESVAVTQPCPNIPMIADVIRDFGINHNDKIAAITSAGTATVYIEEHGN